MNGHRLMAMTNIEVKSFDSAEINNVLPDGLGEAAVVEFGDVKVTRMRIKPGWRGRARRFHTFVTQISHDRADSATAVRKTGITPVAHDVRPPIEEFLCFVSLASGQQPKT
ncbi:MAG: hypothetical protein EBY60_05740 [Actinobacteria bacterium]|nr:hypothetical protein [Actinomycetota bacterium]